MIIQTKNKRLPDNNSDTFNVLHGSIRRSAWPARTGLRPPRRQLTRRLYSAVIERPGRSKPAAESFDPAPPSADAPARVAGGARGVGPIGRAASAGIGPGKPPPPQRRPIRLRGPDRGGWPVTGQTHRDEVIQPSIGGGGRAGLRPQV